MSVISSPEQFQKAVKESLQDQLLIFHSPGSDPARINRYKIIAFSVAFDLDRPIDVFTIDIEQVSLPQGDVLAYQIGSAVICCTTINDGTVMEKALNPFESTVQQMVRNILT